MQPDPEYERYIISEGEWTIIIIGIVFQCINLCGLGYVLYHRNYPPLKIKQISVVTCNLLSGFIWWIGGMSSLRVLPQIGNPVFLLCDFWGIWFQLVFGLWLWACTFIFRLWRLFVIVKLKRTTHGLLFYLTFFIFWGPALLYGILTSAFLADGPLDYEGYFQCHFMDPAMYSIFVLLGLYALVLIVLIIALRSIAQKYLSEYREVRNLLGIMVCFYIVYLVISALDYQRMLWGRCVATAIIILCVTFAFWFIVGIPVYHCIFNREEYLKRFQEQVRHGLSTSESGQKRSDRVENSSTHETPLEMNSQELSLNEITIN